MKKINPFWFLAMAGFLVLILMIVGLHFPAVIVFGLTIIIVIIYVVISFFNSRGN